MLTSTLSGRRKGASAARPGAGGGSAEEGCRAKLPPGTITCFVISALWNAVSAAGISRTTEPAQQNWQRCPGAVRQSAFHLPAAMFMQLLSYLLSIREVPLDSQVLLQSPWKATEAFPMPLACLHCRPAWLNWPANQLDSPWLCGAPLSAVVPCQKTLIRLVFHISLSLKLDWQSQVVPSHQVSLPLCGDGRNYFHQQRGLPIPSKFPHHEQSLFTLAFCLPGYLQLRKPWTDQESLTREKTETWAERLAREELWNIFIWIYTVIK